MHLGLKMCWMTWRAISATFKMCWMTWREISAKPDVMATSCGLFSLAFLSSAAARAPHLDGDKWNTAHAHGPVHSSRCYKWRFGYANPMDGQTGRTKMARGAVHPR